MRLVGSGKQEIQEEKGVLLDVVRLLGDRLLNEEVLIIANQQIYIVRLPTVENLEVWCKVLRL